MKEHDTTLTIPADVAGFSGERLARIDAFMRADIEHGRIPGAVMLIERHGQPVLKRAWGFRDRDAGTPMTLDTIFRIYSMTKPIVSLACLMLAAEGRLRLDQPVSDILPAFDSVKVLRENAHWAPRQPPTVHDLLRHTAGLTYERNGGPVGALYGKAELMSGAITNEEFVARIVKLPLAYEPGRVWNYSHATDVLGRVVEVVEGRPLSAVLATRILEPLGMRETAFHVADEARHGDIAEQIPGDTIVPGGPPLFDPRRPRAFEAGGMGLVSTLDDYARFARMLLAGGTLDRTVFASKHVLRFMTSDHVGPATGIARLPGLLLGPGFGFGLGFAVRLETGAAAYPGSVGEFNWSGVAGTYFWIDPEEDLFAILLTQSPRERIRLRSVVKSMVYDALVGGRSLKAARRRKVKVG